ncbi:MAG: hypothetical protein ACFBSE_07965 [Prochloraceae cyanobacterium]
MASRYLTNLAIHVKLNPDNIAIATSNQLPDRLKEFDTVIFDLRSRNSPNIKLIKDIDFAGSIVVFAPGDLPQDVARDVSNKAADVVVNPIYWSSLRNKEYFR